MISRRFQKSIHLLSSNNTRPLRFENQINRKSNFFSVHNNCYNISTNSPSILNFDSPWWRDVHLPTFSWLTHTFVTVFDFRRCNQANKCITADLIWKLIINFKASFKTIEFILNSIASFQVLVSTFYAKNHFSCFRRSQ